MPSHIDWDKVEPSPKNVVAFMSRHFVALLVHHDLLNKDGSVHSKGVACYSGFLLELHGLSFWVTAGHCLKDDIDANVKTGRVRVTGGGFMDYFNYGAPHHHEYPHTYEVGEGFYVEDPEQGLDYAFIRLNGLETQAFEKNGLVPISRVNWEHQHKLDFDFFLMLGIPSDRVLVKQDKDGEPTASVGQAMIRINKIGVDDLGERPPEQKGKDLDDWFIGRIDPACPIKNIEGMSGGPIYGFRKVGGQLSYHVIALQSRWWPKSRTVFGCSLPLFAEWAYQVLGKAIKEMR